MVCRTLINSTRSVLFACSWLSRHSASDAELAAALIAVRGIGEWTCHMFMMFTLKRGNVLPTGDLGVRKGMMITFGAYAVFINFSCTFVVH